MATIIDNIQYLDSASIQIASLEYASINSGSLTASLLGTASNAITASQGTRVWGYFSYNGTTLVSNLYGCSMSRGAVGSYNVLFSQPVPSSLYCVQCTGHSGSIDASATGSLGWSLKHSTTGFTMSFVKVTVPGVLADITTGSFAVHSY